MACLSHIAANYLIVRKEAKRWGTAHGSIVPYQVRLQQSRVGLLQFAVSYDVFLENDFFLYTNP